MKCNHKVVDRFTNVWIYMISGNSRGRFYLQTDVVVFPVQYLFRYPMEGSTG
jgi:hypothetical protein